MLPLCRESPGVVGIMIGVLAAVPSEGVGLRLT
jgi:hypothetical protein